MTRRSLLVVAMVLGVASAGWAEYVIFDKGIWPDTWPKELETLRAQAKTYDGPLPLTCRYLIPFTKREEFEAAWPHLLKVKTKGAPIILVRGPRTDLFAIAPAGVMVHTPPGADKADGKPFSGERDARSKWANATYLELAVDGEIVDLNRIELPADTPIVDERFKEK